MRSGAKPPKDYATRFRHDAGSPIQLEPIGIVHSPFTERFQAPRQPSYGMPVAARIELWPGRGFEQALSDLEGFSHIWVIYWMHLNRGWNPRVRPPRGSGRKRGLFATRAPHRPNAIGLSCVRLTGVEGRWLSIATHDMLDGTPVLDLKPYLPACDAFPEASPGWTEEIEPGDTRGDPLIPA